MNRLLSLSVIAMFAVAVMVLSSPVASAQGLLWSPAINDIFAKTAIDEDSAITKVQARKRRVRRRAQRRARRGVRRSVRRGGSHEDWCFSRYRSYRSRDNTFQPYNGRRRQCISPYN